MSVIFFISFSTSFCFVLFETTFLFKLFSLSSKSVFFTKSAISFQYPKHACFNLAVEFLTKPLLSEVWIVLTFVTNSLYSIFT